MNAGDLNHEFTLQSPTCNADTPWSDEDTIWGAIRFTTGNETSREGVQTAVGQFIVTIRYRTDLKADWSLYEPNTGRRLQIVSFGDPDGSQEELRVLCAEVQ